MTTMEQAIKRQAAPALGVTAFLAWVLRYAHERDVRRRESERARYARDVAIHAKLVAEGRAHG